MLREIFEIVVWTLGGLVALIILGLAAVGAWFLRFVFEDFTG